MSYLSENIRSSVVRVQGDKRGTGFWVKGKNSKIYLLTCAHVLGKNRKPEIRIHNGAEGYEKILLPKVLAIVPEKEGDLVLLEVKSKDIPGDALPLQLLDVHFTSYPKCTTYGFPKVASEHGRVGVATRVSSMSSNDNLPLYQLSDAGEIKSGFSGAPLVHSEWGMVLGIITALEQPDADSSTSIPYALPASFIAAKLSDYLEAQLLQPYEAWLSSLYQEVVLNDEKGMRLSDAYIEPYFGVHEYGFDKEDTKLEEAKQMNRLSNGFSHFPTSLHEFVRDTLAGKNPKKLKIDKPQVLLLLGYPGQGKSSFCKRLLSDWISSKSYKPAYLVRLRYLADPRSLLNNPLKILKEAIFAEAQEQDYLPESIDLNNSLLILDGLDELRMKSDLRPEDIDNICRELEREAELHSGLQIILTSRYGYVTLERLKGCNILIVQLSELDEAQQLIWLERYRIFHPESHLTVEKLKKYNQEEKFKALQELIRQPILLNMVATLKEDLSDAVNRASIYTRLFDQLIDRPWDKGQIDQLKGLEREDLRVAIQDIAHAVSQSESGYLYKTAMEKLPKVAELNQKIGQSSQVWRTVMVAFYMNEARKSDRQEDESDRDHEYAVEFLHKSLPEYLSAEKIWRSINDEFLDFGKRKKEYLINDAEAALETLYNLFGSRMITQETTSYLIEIIGNDIDIEAKETLLKRLILFFPALLERDFFYYKNDKLPIEVIKATFYGYWTIITHLKEKQNLLQNEGLQDGFVRILKLLVHDANKYILNLSYQHLAGKNLRGAFLEKVNLQFANLKNTNLQFAWLVNSYLQEADLQGALLQGALLHNARLGRAHLEMALLDFTLLHEADLQGASLQGASLQGANLEGAKLQGANLEGAKLHRADLQGANLQGANLRGAKLEGANLQGANLRGAKLEGANLQGANLLNIINLTTEQSLSVMTLFEATGMDTDILSFLQITNPKLFQPLNFDKPNNP